MGIVDQVVQGFDFLFRRKRAHEKYFELTGKPSSLLEPEDILRGRAKRERGFKKKYYKRNSIDRELLKRIESRDNVLIIGPPLSGKTRAVYEALKSLPVSRNIVLPKVIDVDPNDLYIPILVDFLSDRIVVYDDIDKYVGKNNYDYLLEKFHTRHLKGRDVSIIATCRSGRELGIIKDKLGARLFDIFGEPIKITKCGDGEGKKIAAKYNLKFTRDFDGNIGTLFMSLDEMRNRFSVLTEIEKGILRSLNRLYHAGIYEGREIFSLDRLQVVCKESRRIDLTPDQWETHLKVLRENAFIEWNNKGIAGEEAYFYNVIEDHFELFDNFIELLSLFSNDLEALFLLGSRASDLAGVSIAKADLAKIAIRSFTVVFAGWTYETNPEAYAKTQDLIGVAYGKLADVEERVDNCRKAIYAFREALKVYKLNSFPIQYARANNNLGIAHRILGEVQDKAENCRKAIAAYGEALKVYALDRFPIGYAMANNNLGVAYGYLAQVEEGEKNCKGAIIAFREALKVYTLDRFAVKFAGIQGNLGNIYRTLAAIEGNAEYCRKAVVAYREALKVSALKYFSMQYAGTQSNLGTAYLDLADIEDRAENCRNAISIIGEALKVFTLDRFPIQYAMTNENLGYSYLSLAEAEDQYVNVAKTRKAFKEALSGYEVSGFPAEAEKMKKILEQLSQDRGKVSEEK